MAAQTSTKNRIKPVFSGNSRDNHKKDYGGRHGRNSSGTTKLHVAGVGMNADKEEIKRIFDEFGDVNEVHLMPGRDVAFVHIDEKSAEKAMVGMTGKEFHGEKLKVEYGTLSRKPVYDKRANKVRIFYRQN
jgi:RNA recognition motif-containing protein